MENTNTETVQTEVYYNPQTDDKRPMWLNVVIFIATGILAFCIWKAS